MSTILGEVQVLNMPESLHHLHQDSAQIPPVSLLHGHFLINTSIHTCTGAPPRLVVSTILGEVQVLNMPESLHHLRQDSAQIPPVSLLHGLLRVHSPITAMATTPVTTAGGCV